MPVLYGTLAQVVIFWYRHKPNKIDANMDRLPNMTSSQQPQRQMHNLGLEAEPFTKLKGTQKFNSVMFICPHLVKNTKVPKTKIFREMVRSGLWGQ